MASESSASSSVKRCKRLRLPKADPQDCNDEGHLKVRKDLEVEMELESEKSGSCGGKKGKVEVASIDGDDGNGYFSPPSGGLKVREQDVKSDEAVWDLYKRWCTHYKVPRSPEQMKKRFDFFKKTVISIHDNNKKWRHPTDVVLGLNRMSDKTPEEWYRRTSIGIPQ